MRYHFWISFIYDNPWILTYCFDDQGALSAALWDFSPWIEKLFYGDAFVIHCGCHMLGDMGVRGSCSVFGVIQLLFQFMTKW